jgi:hypothetical protein
VKVDRSVQFLHKKASTTSSFRLFSFFYGYVYIKERLVVGER